MSHKHFCDVEAHWWECDGKALRAGDTEPSVCRCSACGLPLEGFNHAGCRNPIELLACPEHREEGVRRMEAFREEFRHRAEEFGLREKCERLRSLPEGAEKKALVQEITEWIFPDCDERRPEA